MRTRSGRRRVRETRRAARKRREWRAKRFGLWPSRWRLRKKNQREARAKVAEAATTHGERLNCQFPIMGWGSGS